MMSDKKNLAQTTKPLEERFSSPKTTESCLKRIVFATIRPRQARVAPPLNDQQLIFIINNFLDERYFTNVQETKRDLCNALVATRKFDTFANTPLLTSIEQLDLSGMALTANDLLRIGTIFPQITTLNISNQTLDAEHLKALSKFKNLHTIKLQATKLTDAVKNALEEQQVSEFLKQCTSLDMSRTTLDILHFELIRNCRNLETLILQQCKIENFDIYDFLEGPNGAILKGHDQLQAVDLAHNEDESFVARLRRPPL